MFVTAFAGVLDLASGHVVYASAGHAFMYVAVLRWDTHNTAGPGDGSAGIGW